MIAPRYPLSPGLGSASANPSKGIFLTFVFVGCLIAAIIVTFKAAYGFTDVFLETPALASLAEQAVALGSLLLSVFGLFAVYIKRLCA